ncbi:MAG: type II toxin-antitoxin system HicA family toxin, partial [Desulfobacteria bacterium]
MNKKQRQTLKRILERPERSDISWVDIESLFIALGADISEGRGSRVRVALNEIRAVFHRPYPKRVTNKGAIKSMTTTKGGGLDYCTWKV